MDKPEPGNQREQPAQSEVESPPPEPDFDSFEQIKRAFGDIERPGDDRSVEDWADEQIARVKSYRDLYRWRLYNLPDPDDVVTQEQFSEAQRTGAVGRSELNERIDGLEERLDREASTGGVGYERRLSAVLGALIHRCRADDDVCYITPSATTIESAYSTVTLDGISELFNGSISNRTCRRYINEIADQYEGCWVTNDSSGGWDGGEGQMRLKMDLETFQAHQPDAHPGLDDE